MSAPRAGPLPPDFFNQQLTQRRAADDEYATVRKKLHIALRMPSTSRWIADWLFLDSDACFHRNIILPPDAFRHSLAIHTHPEQTPHPVPPAHLPPADLLFVPVARLGSVAVGYCFLSCVAAPSRPRSANLAPPHSASRDSSIPSMQFFGRFAFDLSCDDLLAVANGLNLPNHPAAPATTMLMSATPVDDAVVEYHAIACPKRRYSFENLPSRVLSLSGARLYSLPKPHNSLVAQQSCSSPTFLRPDAYPPEAYAQSQIPIARQLHTPDPTHCIVDMGTFGSDGHGLLDNLGVPEPRLSEQLERSYHHNDINPDVIDQQFQMPVKTELDWFAEEGGTTTEPLRTPRRHGHNIASDEAFNFGTLSESLERIRRIMTGEVRTDGLEQSFTAAGSGLPPAGPSGNISMRFETADAALADMLTEMAAQSYYSSILTVENDERCGGAPHKDAQHDVHTAEDTIKPVNAVRLKPRPRSGTDCNWRGSEGPLGISAEEARRLEERKEAQRRRNRMSAARSYEKRKKRKQLQKKQESVEA